MSKVLIEAWRITQRKFAIEAFTGSGARLYGGRWNHPGISLVYTAQSRSLAILEILVHLRKTTPFQDFVLFPVTFHDALVQTLDLQDLPSNWDAEPPQQSTQLIGNAWVDSGTHPVLSVPSVVVPEERNYLLNPTHPLFSRIKFGNPVECRIDSRLL